VLGDLCDLCEAEGCSIAPPENAHWLTSDHQDLLRAGQLKMPSGGGHGEHPAVLVSTPDGFGSPVAWVDVEIAELVWLLNCGHGIRTIESCQGDWEHYPEAYLAFRSRRECSRFLDLVGEILPMGGYERYDWGRCVSFDRYASGAPPEDRNRLASITTAVRKAES
jgi:hypothetical protein